jgi:protein TonB
MFEDSLVESRVGYVSASNRWTALASISLQFAAAAVMIALPLLHPEALSFHPDTPKVVLPLSPKAPVTVVRVKRASAASTSLAATTIVRAVSLPSLLPSGITTEAPALAPIDAGIGMHADLPASIAIGEAGS